MSNRDTLRKATLGATREFRKELVEWEGQQFEIRQPTIKARAELQSKCVSSKGKDIQTNTLNFMVWAVIQNTYVPKTDDLVFEDADFEALAGNPTGGFMDTFFEVAARLTNIDVESAKKPSKTTASGS